MVTRDALLSYNMPSGETRLALDLFPALPQGYGASTDMFKSAFRLTETNEVPGLRSLRAETTLAPFLEFFGSTLGDACAKWPTLAWMCDYREAHDAEAYAGVVQWIRFYDLLTDRIVPFRIELAIVEHY